MRRYCRDAGPVVKADVVDCPVVMMLFLWFENPCVFPEPFGEFRVADLLLALSLTMPVPDVFLGGYSAGAIAPIPRFVGPVVAAQFELADSLSCWPDPGGTY